MKDLSINEAVRYSHAKSSLYLWEAALLECNGDDIYVYSFYTEKYIHKFIALYLIEEEFKDDNCSKR